MWEYFLEWVDSVLSKLSEVKEINELENIRVSIFGKKGFLTLAFEGLKTLPNSSKKIKAKELNDLKIKFEILLKNAKDRLLDSKLEEEIKSQKIDSSLFYNYNPPRFGHPINLMLDRIIDYFVGSNFSIKYGPLVDDDFHSFEALNIPKFHPARAMQDTFYFSDNMLLRPHTSSVQIRSLENLSLPLRIISPGAVFRRDYDMTHTPMFHQVEGLVVDSNVSFANLKYILEDFLKHIFGDIKIRFRSSFFPFTEPSAEVDINCVFCNGKGCKVCSHTGWLEVLGCGQVDNRVFEILNIKNVSGYAFGLGVERFAMLFYKVNDLRSFFETDLRLLEQF